MDIWIWRRVRLHGQSAQRLANEIGWSTRTIERGLATLWKTGWVAAYPNPEPIISGGSYMW